MRSHPLIDAIQTNPGEAAHHGGWSLEADHAHADAVGLQADALRLRRDTPSAHDAPHLAERLARRTTYLLEPLTVVESEPERALLRSDDPNAEGESRDFYDLWVTPQELIVERYHGERGQPREARPLNLTWEQAERLVRDAETLYQDDSA